MRGGPQSSEVMEYALTSLIKLSERFPENQGRIQSIISKYKQSSLVELQQRACEFDRLFKHSKIRAQLLEQMPSLLSGDGDEDEEASAQHQQNSNGADMLAGGDLLGDLGVGGGSSSSPVDALADLLGDAAVAAPTQAPGPGQAQGDLMDLLGGGGMPAASVQPGGDLLADMLGGGEPSPAPAPALPSILVYEKNGVTVEFSFVKGSGGSTTINGVYKNASPNTVLGFSVQAAVPKYIQLRMDPASGNQLPPLGSGFIQQSLHVVNSMVGQKPLMMRLKLTYQLNGAPVMDMVEVKNFPSGL